jgi:hypothetical protein
LIAAESRPFFSGPKFVISSMRWSGAATKPKPE